LALGENNVMTIEKLDRVYESKKEPLLKEIGFIMCAIFVVAILIVFCLLKFNSIPCVIALQCVMMFLISILFRCINRLRALDSLYIKTLRQLQETD